MVASPEQVGKVGVQASASCREKMVRDGGINEILVAVAPYHKEKQPLRNKEEEEYVLELCNILSACLIDGAARARFVEDEGVELMILVLKGRQFYRTGVLKVWQAFARYRFHDLACLLVL